MAKAAEIEIHPWEPYRVAAARIVSTRARELFEQAEGVLDISDIERVHDMRVASRRLRAVMEIFAPCFPPDLFKACLKDVKRIADALGERRDPDVHIDAMTAFASAVPEPQRPGVESLVASMREHQARGNVSLASELERMQANDLAGRLQALADRAADPQ